MSHDRTLWGIHAGRTGDADSLFLEKNVVAIGWAGLGDLGRSGVTVRPSRRMWRRGCRT